MKEAPNPNPNPRKEMPWHLAIHLIWFYSLQWSFCDVQRKCFKYFTIYAAPNFVTRRKSLDYLYCFRWREPLHSGVSGKIRTTQNISWSTQSNYDTTGFKHFILRPPFLFNALALTATLATISQTLSRGDSKGLATLGKLVMVKLALGCGPRALNNIRLW